MNLWNRLTRGSRVRTNEREQGHTLVLLLRQAQIHLPKDEVEKAAEAGWTRRFDGQEDPMYFVVQQGNITMIKAGIYAVHLVQANQPLSRRSTACCNADAEGAKSNK